MNVDSLSPAQQESLLTLLRHEQPGQGLRKVTAFPGAIGRKGTALVRLGLAHNHGRHVYAGNNPKMGELPDAYTKFTLTEKGRQFAQQLLRRQSKKPSKHTPTIQVKPQGGEADYDVHITRTVSATVVRTIRAGSALAARLQAAKLAGDIDFSGLEKSAEYDYAVNLRKKDKAHEG